MVRKQHSKGRTLDSFFFPWSTERSHQWSVV